MPDDDEFESDDENTPSDREDSEESHSTDDRGITCKTEPHLSSLRAQFCLPFYDSRPVIINAG